MIYFSFFLCMYICAYVHMHASTHESRKRALDPLELKLLVFVSYQICVLGTKFGNLGPLYEQQALLATELSLQPLTFVLMTHILTELS